MACGYTSKAPHTADFLRQATRAALVDMIGDETVGSRGSRRAIITWASKDATSRRVANSRMLEELADAVGTTL